MMETEDLPDEGPQMSSTLNDSDISTFTDSSSSENKNLYQDLDVPSIRIIPSGDSTTVCTGRRFQAPRVVDSLPRIDELVSPGKRQQTFPKSLMENDDDSGFLGQDTNDKRRVHRYKLKRPPDLEILEDIARAEELYCDGNSSISHWNKTPIEPSYPTPPVGRNLDADQTKMVLLLKSFGLARLIDTFLVQEVDTDLFLTLSDQDLREIGIKRKTDRSMVLSVIAECNRHRM